MKCIKCTDQHDTSMGRKILSPRQESNPWPPEHRAGVYPLNYEKSWRVRLFKVNVHLQGCLAGKQCSASGLNCRYLNPYIKLKLIGLAIRLYQNVLSNFSRLLNASARITFWIDPLHKWRPNLNNNSHTSLASHSCENFFVFKHECEAKDVPSIVIQI